LNTNHQQPLYSGGGMGHALRFLSGNEMDHFAKWKITMFS
jgi:hypothetical protein